MKKIFTQIGKRWKLLLRIAGGVGILVALYLIISGVVAFSSASTVKDSEDYSKTWTLHIDRDTQAIVFPAAGEWMPSDMYHVKIKVESVNNGKQLMVVKTDAVTVDQWLSGIGYDEVTVLRLSPERILFEEHNGGTIDAAPEGTQQIGADGLVMRWDPPDEALVLMNEDLSSGLDIDVSIWTQAAYQFIAGMSGVVVGVFLLLLSLAFVLMTRKSRSSMYPMPLDLPPD